MGTQGTVLCVIGSHGTVLCVRVAIDVLGFS